jgi:hypothetical protein
MRDPQSQQAMFRMAHAYEVMARLLEKTSVHIPSRLPEQETSGFTTSPDFANRRR